MRVWFRYQMVPLPASVRSGHESARNCQQNKAFVRKQLFQ